MFQAGHITGKKSDEAANFRPSRIKSKRRIKIRKKIRSRIQSKGKIPSCFSAHSPAIRPKAI